MKQMYRMYRRLLLFIISFSIASSLYAQEEEDYDEINLEEVTVQNFRIDSLVQNTPASKAPVIIFIVVVFPAPLSPRKPVISPS